MDVFSLVVALAAIAVMAAAVTVTDAAWAGHWRGVAMERRRSWHARFERDSLPDGRLPVRGGVR
jgi:hypothetical protein